MSGTSQELRDKAVLDGLTAMEDFLDMLECLGCVQVAVEALDEHTFVVSWVSPSGTPCPAPPC